MLPWVKRRTSSSKKERKGSAISLMPCAPPQDANQSVVKSIRNVRAKGAANVPAWTSSGNWNKEGI
jgi:hypothetical protein